MRHAPARGRLSRRAPEARSRLRLAVDSTSLPTPLCFLSFQSTRNDSSRVAFVPEIDDHEKELLCRVDNPLLEDSAIEDSFVLEVHCE